jgi:NAD(P)-dependent dehydrogenase (short-subunit alcohol dehydrogenase family)
MSDDYFLRNRSTIAIITGGTQGLGLAIATRLAREGAPGVVISGRNAEKGEGAAEKLRSIGTDCLFVKADVSTANDCYSLVEAALKRFGNVNGLVNSAGLADRGTLLDTSLQLWERQFNTNARGPFLLMQGVVRHLIDTGQPGSIVNILSMVAHCGQSYLTPYSASKGALATLTKNVANAFAAKRIRCNGILTGWMDNPRRKRDPAEVPRRGRRLVGESGGCTAHGAVGETRPVGRTGCLPAEPGVRRHDGSLGGL